MHPFELRTLSGAALLSASGSELLGPGKPLALLIYLACSPRRAAGREHLVDLLWSDLPPDKARHALRQTIWYLRQILGAALEAVGTDLVLASGIPLDRDRFLAAVNRDDLEAAMAIYQTDFLAQFAAPGGLDFEHWADIERQQLRAVFLRTVEQLARRQLDAGPSRDAISLARRGRDAAPQSERMWRLLLEALSAGRDRLGLSMEVAALRTRLEHDQREPEAATRTLLDRLDAAEETPIVASPVTLNPELVGRESQFSAILQEWEAIRSHGGRHMHLTAGAGLGKTRLLGEVHRRLRTRGVRTVFLRATPGDRDVPFSLAGDLARAFAALPGAAGVSPGSAATLVALDPALSSRYSVSPDSATGLEAARRRSRALSELLGSVAEEQPFALLLDDLHWADSASHQALGPLFHRIGEIPALVVTAARPTAGGTSIIGEGHALNLPPLTLGQVRELVGSLGTVPAADWAGSLYRGLTEATGGSPLLVLETLQLALERECLRLEAGNWSCPDWGLLARLLSEESALRQRVARLDPEEGRLLLVMAVAGNALSASELSRATGWDSGVIDRLVIALEQRGLAQRVGDQWEPAHDEIAALVLEQSDEMSRLATHGAIGEMLAGSAPESRAGLVRAGRHLAIAGRWPELRSAFLRYVRRLRNEGDARRIRHLAGDFLEGMPEATVARLLKTLGRLNHLRYDLARPAVGVAGLAVVAVALAVFMLTRPTPADGFLLIREAAGVEGGALRRLPIYRAGWSPLQPIDARHAPEVPLPAALRRAGAILSSPSGRTWVANVETGDSNTIDVSLLSRSGHTTPFVTGPRDDNAASWLPDGSGILLTTARWSPAGADDYDVMIQWLDGRSRRLTATPDHDILAYASPDGTRIAFLREPRGRPPEYCVISFSGDDEPRCLTGLGQVVGGLIGWSDRDHILILRVSPDGLNDLLLVEVQSGRPVVILRDVRQAAISPSGAWLAYEQLPVGRTVLSLFVCPTQSPQEAREVVGLGSTSGALQWQEPSAGRLYLDRLQILERGRVLPSHAAHLVRAAALDSRGKSIDYAFHYSWSSGDTSIATLDSTGLLRPRRDGSVLVTVSAGGWRTDTATIEIRASPTREVLSETWDRGLAGWIPFGSPAPEIVRDERGRVAFWNRGDGSYPSGAYSRNSWPGDRGFGVEVEASVPLTLPQWQTLTLALVGGLDSAALGSWDHRTGGLPLAGLLSRLCGVAYPSGEGWESRSRLSINAATLSLVAPVDSQFHGGRWLPLRVQVFPDGTCGVAVDGRPLWRTRVSMPLDKPFAILLGTASSRTRVLHGRLTAWTGVRDDVDWPSLGFQGTSPK